MQRFTLGTGAIFAGKVPNFIVGQGEQLSKTGRLYLIRLHSIRIHGEQFFQIWLLCLIAGNPWGTILSNLASVPKPHAGVAGAIISSL